MNTHSYSDTYRRLLDDELDELLDDFDNLEPDAQSVLTSEVLHRGRTQEGIAGLIDAGRKRKLSLEQTENVDLHLTVAIGRVRRFRGSGRAFIGKSNLFSNREYWYDEFDTSLWWTLFFVPVLPRGSFRIRKKTVKLRMPNTDFIWRDEKFIAVNKLPFQWQQNIFPSISAAFFWFIVLRSMMGVFFGPS